MNLEGKIFRPSCSRPLTVRSGTFGTFLGCTGYPKCQFTHSLTKSSRRQVYCPKCSEELTISYSYSEGVFLECPKCDFKYYIH